MPTTQITEYRRHVDKPDEQYACELLHRNEDYVVLKYDVTEEGHIGPVAIPPGSLTIAHYWGDRPYVLWEMYDPERSLIGYCYHICTPPEITPDTVTYLDLLLDVWFGPEGSATILDVDEFEQAVVQGQLTDDQQELSHSTLQSVERQHPQLLTSLWHPPEGIEGV